MLKSPLFRRTNRVCHYYYYYYYYYYYPMFRTLIFRRRHLSTLFILIILKFRPALLEAVSLIVPIKNLKRLYSV